MADNRTCVEEGRAVPRLLPDRTFPPYAYLPGRSPHPIRDPGGHSYKAEVAATLEGRDIDPDALRWGADLFNHRFYWEAHEAWEDLWRSSPKGGPERDALQGLILLAAAGFKLREGKLDAARRHARRAASYLRRVDDAASVVAVTSLGWSPSSLAARAEEAVSGSACFVGAAFDFKLGYAARS